MNIEKMVHKETFYQRSEEGIPGTWVVFYWNVDECDDPFMDTHKAAYFPNEEGARQFEDQLIKYDDWLTSQEIPLAVQ